MRGLHLALALTIAVPGVARPQATTGHLTGRVGTETGAALVSATVTVSGPDLLTPRTTTTNALGIFLLPPLPPGAYSVRIQAIGYRPLVVNATPVVIGRRTDMGVLTLTATPVVLADITVAAADLRINPTGTITGGHLEARDYDALPVTRDYRSVIEMLPQANHSYYPDDQTSIMGATGLENLFFVDGVNLTDPMNGGPGSSTLPYNFVRAIEVTQGGLDARSGGTVGGITNAVTYSGGERFESNIFGFFTSSGLQGARIAPGQIAPVSSANYDVGVRVGGPLKSRSLWFSAAYNPQVEQTDLVIPGFGTHQDRLVRHLFAGKITWQVNARTSAAWSLMGERSGRDVVTARGDETPLAPEPFLARRDFAWTASALRVVRQIRRGAEIEARLSLATFSTRLRPRTPAGEGPAFFDFVSGETGGGFGSWDSTRTARIGAAVQASFEAGAHQLTSGAEYQVASFRPGSGYWTISRDVIDTMGTEFWVQDSTGSLGGRLALHTATLFIQDYWNVSPRLTVGAGLRWSGEYIIGAGRMLQSLPNEWQPRLSFSLKLGRRDHRVFGSWGIVYQQQPLANWASFYTASAYPQRYYSADPRAGGVTPDSADDYGIPSADIPPNRRGLQSDNYAELALGVEPSVSRRLRLSVRGVRRVLRGTVGYAFNPGPGPLILVGTPGKGVLSFLPPATRNYTALELTANWDGPGALALSTAYVLSHTHGNFIGYYDERGFPQVGRLSVQSPEQIANSTGDLPNDRRHVVKLLATYPFRFGLTLGAFANWQSGTPLNAFRVLPPTQRLAFVVPRGSAGRLPGIWDVNVRLTYGLPLLGRRAHTVVDIMHLFSQPTVVLQNQIQYRGLGTTLPTPNFGKPQRYLPPTQVRLGVTIDVLPSRGRAIE